MFIPLRRRNQCALALCVTGLVLAPPSFLLPFVTVNKLGNTHVCFLINTAYGLWQNGMAALGGWVLFCGTIAPLALLCILTAAFSNQFAANGTISRGQRHLARILAQWAMPEVLILAVLVAFFKVRDLVNMRLGPGFWCYLGVALLSLLASHSFIAEFGETTDTPRREKESS